MSFISGGTSYGRQSINRGTLFIEATGGSVDAGQIDGDYKYHIFNSDGNFIVSSPGTAPDNVVEYLVIGAGGDSGPWSSGGGGAGAYRTATGHVVTGQDYTIQVGIGGSSSTNGRSIFDTITSGRGGQGSGSTALLAPPDGDGSGGGRWGGSGTGPGGVSGAYGYDGGSQNNHNGGYPSGGGGGAGQAGYGNPNNSTSGAGGNGVASSITGSSVTRAGGGGGGGNYYSQGGTAASGGSGGGGNGNSNGVGTVGAANTGSGGGGGSATASNGGNEAIGGSGVVILRYKFQWIFLIQSLMITPFVLDSSIEWAIPFRG